jgi:hypothetical protein
MANVSGITIERTASRTPHFARIDLRKYGEVFLQYLGHYEDR